jgi:hypothetical protein
MRRRSFLGVCAQMSLAGMVGLYGTAQTAVAKSPAKKSAKHGDKENPDGWLWSYVAKKGDKEVSGTFRVVNHEIFKDKKKVGRVEPQGGRKKGDTTVLTLTDFGGRLDGKAVLEKKHSNPAVWRGTLTTKNGDEWDFKAKVADYK